jgi:hypothetical protein
MSGLWGTSATLRAVMEARGRGFSPETGGKSMRKLDQTIFVHFPALIVHGLFKYIWQGWQSGSSGRVPV